MKIAIVTHLAINPKENEMLLEACKELTGDGMLIEVDELVLTTGEGKPDIKWAKGNLLDYDVYLVRDISHALKKSVVIVEWLRNRGKVVIDNNLSKVRFTIDKIRTFFEVSEAGLPVPRTMFSQNKELFMKNVDEIGYPVVIKSNSAGKGAYIYKCNGEEEVQELVKEIEKKGRKWERYLIQEFIAYKRDLRVFVLGKKAVAVMHRIPKPGEFKANFSYGGSVEATELTPEIKKMSETAAEAADCDFAGVDLLETDTGKYYVLEVNRSPGFVGMSKATGEDYGVKVIQYCMDIYNKAAKGGSK